MADLGQAGNIISGVVGGAATGAKVGGIAGPEGAIAGGIIGGVAGGIKSGRTNKQRSSATTPSLEDPTQTSRLLEVDRIAKNIASGTDAATQTAIQEGEQALAGTQSRLSRLTGGNVGATVDALLKSQRAQGQSANQAIAQGQGRLPFFMNLGQQISQRASQRSLELQLLDRAQNLAEAAQSTKEQNVNRNAALASGVPGASDAFGRIQSLLNFNKASGGLGEEGIINPNASLNQTTISGAQAPPSLAPLNAGVPVEGLGSLGSTSF